MESLGHRMLYRDILVIGRAITQNPDPGRAAQAIADSLGMGE